MPRGGKRPGAGRPKGSKEPKTLEKEAAREALRNMVKAKLQPMVEAQIANAMGIKYLVKRDAKTGKFVTLDEAQAAQMIASGDVELVEVWEKVPNVQAFQDLLDRTLDKPTQHVDMKAEHSGAVALVDTLAEARKRLNEAKRG